MTTTHDSQHNIMFLDQLMFIYVVHSMLLTFSMIMSLGHHVVSALNTELIMTQHTTHYTTGINHQQHRDTAQEREEHSTSATDRMRTLRRRPPGEGTAVCRPRQVHSRHLSRTGAAGTVAAQQQHVSLP